MTFKQWLHNASGPRVGVARASRRGKSRQPSRRRVVPRLELLEDRLTPATFIVNSTAGAYVSPVGIVTLPEAILASTLHTQVNGTGPTGSGNDTIQFSSAIAGQTISLTGFATSATDPFSRSILAGASAFFIDNNETLVIDGETGLTRGITIARDTNPADYPGTPQQAPNFRLFDVAAGSNLILKGLTLENGDAKGFNGGDGGNGGGGSAGMGGAIFNQGLLTLQDSTLSGNIAQGGAGGAWFIGPPQSSGGGGAGLGSNGYAGQKVDYQYGASGGGPNGGAGAAAKILRIPAIANYATPGGFGGGGGSGVSYDVGPIVFPGAAGGFGGGGGGGGFNFNISSSFAGPGGNGGFGGGGGGGKSPGNGGFAAGDGGFAAGNGAYGGGGAGLGGAVFNEGGTVLITNSTLTGNTAIGGSVNDGSPYYQGQPGNGSGWGGGLFNVNGSLSITNSTIFSNKAHNGSAFAMVGDSAQDGQAKPNTTATALINNTILSDLVFSTSSGGTATVSGHANLIASPVKVGAGATNNLVGTLTTNPDLDSPRSNGGLTQTMALQDDSPAINAGDKALAPLTDQRGASRDPLNQGKVDIARYESRSSTVGLTVNSPADETTDSSTLSLRQAIDLANGTLSFASLTTQEGLGLVRQQITNQVNPSPFTITFDSKLDGHTLTLSTVGDSSVGPSAFLVNNGVLIQGPSGNSGITLSAAGTTMRLFDVTGAGNLTLENLTLANGVARGFAGGSSTGGAGGGSAGLGGAIFNQGSLTILDSTLTGNTAVGGSGGSTTFGDGTGGTGGAGGAGLDQQGGYASGDGGAAGGGPNGGSGRRAVGFPYGGDAYGGFGGGGGGGYGYVPFVGASARAALGPRGAGGGFGGGGGGGGDFDGSANPPGGYGGFGGGGGGGAYDGHIYPGSLGGAGGVSHYGGGSGGAGIGQGGGGGGGAGMGGAVFNEAGTVSITNSTFYSNAADGASGGSSRAAEDGTAGKGLGGGLFNRNGAITVTNSTFSSNTAADGGRDIFNLGDSVGKTTVSTTATATITNTILGQSDQLVEDFTGKTNGTGGINTAFASFSVIGSSSGLTGGSAFFSGIDPQLEPLQDNGGPTPTMALSALSPAIDKGIKAGAPPTDQRGVPRDPDNVGTVDIGAFEVSATFSALTSPSIIYGTSTITLTGHIGAGTAYPTGSSVAITLNTVTHNPQVDVDGNFTTTFNTASLGVAAGPYTVTYAFAGNAGLGAVTNTSTAVTVTKAAATVTVTPYSVTYDGNAHTATYTITGVNGETGATVGSVTLNSTHTNAGTYATDSWTFAATDNYKNIGCTTITDIINMANATFFVAPYTVTYDGTAHTATITSITGVNGETGATVGVVTLYSTHTNAGTYASDSWSFTATANYNNIASTTITDTISQADATVKVTPYSVAFDGSPHTATYTITGVNGESGATVGAVTLNSTHTAPGAYTSDFWSFTGTANYNNIASTPFTDTITATTPVLTNPTATSVTSTIATLGGTVNSDGGASLLKRGILYASSPANLIPGGSGVMEVDSASVATGVFAQNLTGLKPNTSYSFVAFATNSQGIGYSPVGNFTTTILGPVSSIAGPTSGKPSDLLTFVLNGFDPVPGMQLGRFVFHITWGDGKSNVVTGLNAAQGATQRLRGQRDLHHPTVGNGRHWQHAPDRDLEGHHFVIFHARRQPGRGRNQRHESTGCGRRHLGGYPWRHFESEHAGQRPGLVFFIQPGLHSCADREHACAVTR